MRGREKYAPGSGSAILQSSRAEEGERAPDVVEHLASPLGVGAAQQRLPVVLVVPVRQHQVQLDHLPGTYVAGSAQSIDQHNPRTWHAKRETPKHQHLLPAQKYTQVCV